MGTTHFPVQWVLMFFPHWGGIKSGQGMKLTTHLNLVQRLRLSGAIPLSCIWLHGMDTEILTFLLYVNKFNYSFILYMFVIFLGV